MDRDLTPHFGEGAREAPQPTVRRVQQAAHVAQPPRTARTDDRAEFVAYAGAWRESQYPADDFEDDVADAEVVEDQDDDQGDGWDFVPIGGRR
ncbi:hypothetical protein EF910_31970 [Streptomyces sp. WAC07149]|uniref:hypothetical protein n=1 Tax=Streptomyces sp. WAC07149 TaxID=2487425 RepID=UPI000F796B3B|nr:hypothetical protein [Streptomyces sp. WAC07149]RST00355.1 hypothetical protein EF910_31970 [Streptomyces sp. WAC07149]